MRCRKLWPALAIAIIWFAAGLSPLKAQATKTCNTDSTSWTTFAFNAQRTGFNPCETVLSSQNVPGMVLHWSLDLGRPITAQPVVFNGVVYVATMTGFVDAMDSSTGAIVWQAQLPAVPTSCDDFAATQGWAGVIATPTIDPTQNRLLIAGANGQLHALDLKTGVEAPGWPVQVFDPANATPSSLVYTSPTLYRSPLGGVSRLYVATASACDTPPYRGQVIQVSPDTGTVTARWYTNGINGLYGGGIWGPGGVSVEPDGSSVYAATGNSLGSVYDAPYSDAVVELSPQLSLLTFNIPPLVGDDVDFGATPLLYQAPACPPQMAVMNKTGALFVYNRAGIGYGVHQQLQVANPPDSGLGNFIGVPAYDPVNNQVYIGSTDDSVAGPYRHGLLAFHVVADCLLSLSWQQTFGMTNLPVSNPVIPPVVANGVVYYADGDSSQVVAFDAASGAFLWDTASLINGGIFASPTVVNGQLFVAAFDHKIYAFGL